MKEKLKELRKLAGLTQEELADKAGCSTRHISNMEQGTSAVTLKTLLKYSAVLGVYCDVNITFNKKQDEK